MNKKKVAASVMAGAVWALLGVGVAHAGESYRDAVGESEAAKQDQDSTAAESGAGQWGQVKEWVENTPLPR
ncbi:hypothetical protein [Nocardia sp. IFM 10818]